MAPWVAGMYFDKPAASAYLKYLHNVALANDTEYGDYSGNNFSGDKGSVSVSGESSTVNMISIEDDAGLNRAIEKLNSFVGSSCNSITKSDVNEVTRGVQGFEARLLKTAELDRSQELAEVGVAPGNVNLWLAQNKAFDLVDDGYAAIVTKIGANFITMTVDEKRVSIRKANAHGFRSVSKGECLLTLYEIHKDKYTGEELAGLNLGCKK